MNLDSIVGRVETFINRLHNSSITIDEGAKNITYKRGVEMKSLADILGEQIHYYKRGKESNEPYYPSASDIFEWINKAYTNGVVKESNSLLEQLAEKDNIIKKSEEDKLKLKEQLQKLSTDYIRLQGRYEELEEKLRQILPKTDTGI